MNINDGVRFKLTEHGKRIYEASSQSYHEYDDYCDEEGYYNEQLWVVMRIFGEHMYCGCKQVFVNNEIILEV
jgi:hypothetical protein